MILDSLFYETALILAASATLGALALWLRQPLLVAFIVVGILVIGHPDAIRTCQEEEGVSGGG